MTPFKSSEVEAVFNQYSPQCKEALLTIRQLIIDISAELTPHEKLVENLKWNQPTYTAKAGTPIRIGIFEETKIALFFHCQTTLIEQFRELFADSLVFSKNRAIIMDPTKPLPINDLKLCIQMGLTYHSS